MSYQTPDSKKEEFRKYLEKSGVIDALTKGRQGARLRRELPAPRERRRQACRQMQRAAAARQVFHDAQAAAAAALWHVASRFDSVPPEALEAWVAGLPHGVVPAGVTPL